MHCILLVNYNNSTQTIAAVYRALNLSFDKIVVVDNGSTDNSFFMLTKEFAENESVDILNSQINNGFGFGNNYGIKYINEHYECNLLTIANTDVFFESDTISQLKKVLYGNESLIAVSCSTRNVDDSLYHSCRKLPTIKSIFRDNIYLLRKIYLKKKMTKMNNLSIKSDWFYVGAVSTGLCLFDFKKLLNIGGFDESIFLYYEEDALFKKAELAGLKIAYLPHLSYLHNHNYLRNVNLNKSINVLKISRRSALYFMKKYLKANRFTIFTFTLLSYMHYLFMRIIVKLKSF